MNHEQARQLIERQFEEGPLEPDERRALFAYVRQHEDLKRLYDRHARLAEALGDTDARAAQVDRIVSTLPTAPAKPLDLAAARRRRWAPGIAGAALALAAGISLFYFAGAKVESDAPEYALLLSPGAQTVWSAPNNSEAVPRFEPTTRFEARLVPGSEFTGSVAVRAALVGDSDSIPIGKEWARAASGALRLVGSAAELFGERQGHFRFRVTLTAGDRTVVMESPLVLGPARADADAGP